MDRLLSEQEITNAIGYIAIYDSFKQALENVAKAQLAKADKEWVEWGESACTHTSTKHKRHCLVCWLERRDEVGI